MGYIEALVKLEHAWVPTLPGCSLYIRPVIFSSEPTLEVRVGREFMHYIFLSPVGPYFAKGFNPVSVHISHEYVRAVRGGTGEAKTTANYAGTVWVAEQVRQQGYQQVLWLDAIERRYIEEVGAMNIMFVRDGKHIVTPALSGSILHGVTRESVLQLAPDLGLTISEERIDVDDMLADIEKGRITEAFGVGTAAVVSPVGKFGYKGKEYRINDEKTGPVAQKLYTALTDIQYGRAPDPYGWTRQIKVN
jgi:branched-chain amino acid aminotransferase